MGRVQDKIAIVTGGATGIGRATARRLAEEGALVTITDRNVEAGQAVAAELPGNAAFIAQDVRLEDDWKALMAAVTERHGRLDILVNNAGILATGPSQDLEATDLEQWRAVQAVNAEGVFLGCHHGIGAMKAGGGSIINLSSIAGLIGTPHLAAYGASKGAVRQLSKSVAVYCGRKGYGIRCNSVHPGIIRTDMGDQVMGLGGGDPQANWESRIGLVPLGEAGEAVDVANCILFLASDEARHVTGAELVVDGGMTAI
ncbi:MAG: glucose 1-dehydrogenase [Alphaproteobacteria bacterium]|nr:glucose 1-dehydrogenase [Alphaproteobacteria bacterium]MDP6563938.1 glucose 1-dehydrogenase [Alphaproteobacteria bacterium]MDP6815290.1 glucose 1-dehydrogenase [Alphaproteobacteria bacterium]